jgi:phospholipase C
MPTPAFSGASPSTIQSRLTASPIQHVVVMIQENRTFNDFFATYPGADGTTTAKVLKVDKPGCHVFHGVIQLTESDLAAPGDLNHDYQAFQVAMEGKLQAFDKINFQGGKPECKTAYQYVNPAQIKPYWNMAQQYTLAEHMYSTQGSNSFTAHQDLIRGGTNIDPNYALVNDPTEYPWGCDAPAATRMAFCIRVRGRFHVLRTFRITAPMITRRCATCSMPRASRGNITFPPLTSFLVS